jgi:hypothetical protein
MMPSLRALRRVCGAARALTGAADSFLEPEMTKLSGLSTVHDPCVRGAARRGAG